MGHAARRQCTVAGSPSSPSCRSVSATGIRWLIGARMGETTVLGLAQELGMNRGIIGTIIGVLVIMQLT